MIYLQINIVKYDVDPEFTINYETLPIADLSF
jgi:hypothetical protein